MSRDLRQPQSSSDWLRYERSDGTVLHERVDATGNVVEWCWVYADGSTAYRKAGPIDEGRSYMFWLLLGVLALSWLPFR